MKSYFLKNFYITVKIKILLYKYIGDNIIKRKIILTALIMFVLVSLTAVSAVDTNQTDDLAAEDSDTVTQDILTDESVGDGDFKELNDNVTSATTTLELTKNYTYNPVVVLDYKNGINITKDISVD